MSSLGLLHAAGEQVRTQRLRAALSMISIVVGVATLTVVVGLGDVVGSVARSVIERQAGKAATVTVLSERPAGGFIVDVLPRLEARLDRYSITERSPVVVWPTRLILPDAALPTGLVGVVAALKEIRSFRILDGRWSEADDATLLAPALVANAALARAAGLELPGTRDGVLIYLNGQTLAARLVGIVDDGDNEARLYGSMPALLRLATPATASTATLVLHVEPARVAALLARLRSDLASQEISGVQLLRTDSAEQFAAVLSGIALVLAAIAGISLVTGALGILNLGIVTTRQRAREFAIRRSFGAGRADVFVIVMAESLLTALVGGAIGVALAIGAISVLPLALADRLGVIDLPPFPLAAAMTGLVVAVAIGLLAGFVPARLATRVSVIETIRA